jgi:hypothetical protein
LEQIKDQQRRREMKKDFDEAWDEVRTRDNLQRTERETFISTCRWREGQSIQDFQKNQMSDKLERSMKIYEEINDERKQYAKMCKENIEMEQEKLRDEYKVRKVIGEDISVKLTLIL